MPKDAAAMLIGPLSKESDDEMDEMDDEMESGGDMKAEAGNALASAIKSGDGAAICEAVKAIMDLEYDAEE